MGAGCSGVQRPYDCPETLASKLSSGKPCVVAFLAPNCGLCASLAPAMAQVEAGGSAEVARLDSSQSGGWAPELLNYEVHTVPCFVLLDPEGRGVCKTSDPNGRLGMEAALQAMVEHAAKLSRRRR